MRPSGSPLNIRFVMSGLVLVILLGAIEQTVVAVALPAIASDLKGFGQLAWVISAYLVACAVTTPIWGKLSDIHGRSAALSAAIVIFILASIGCALASNMPQLIAFRVLQGMGGGGLISVAQATISNVIPPRERGRYQGYISGVFAAASLAGPVLGGYLTQYLSWRWIFWINLPLGLAALMLIRQSLRHLAFGSTQRTIDYPGAIMFATGLAAVLTAITRAGHGVALTETLNLILSAGGVVVLAGFGWHQNRIAAPLIPVSLLSNRTIAVCCALLFLAFFQFISMSVLLPLRFRIARGLGVDVAALHLLPLTLAISAGAFLAGRMMSASGRYKQLQLTGTIAAAAGSLTMALCRLDQSAAMVLAMCVMGLGIGLQFPTSLVAAQNEVGVEDIGVATALTSLSRLLGGAVGIALLSSLLGMLLHRVLPEVPGDQIFDFVLNSVAHRDAADRVFRQMFMVSAAASLVGPFLVLLLQEKALRKH